MIGSLNSGYQLIFQVTLYENALRQLLQSRKKASNSQKFRIWWDLSKKLFHSHLLNTRLVIANSALRDSLIIHHLISNEQSVRDLRPKLF